MSARLRALWRNTTSKLCQQQGNSMIIGIGFLILMTLVFLAVFERWRLMNVTAEASRKVTATITSLASSHLNDSYSPIRDSTSGAFVFNGVTFEEIKDTQSFYRMFNNLFSFTELTNGSVKGGVNLNTYLYEISQVSVMVSNAGTAAGVTLYRVSYTLAVPQDLLWKGSEVRLLKQMQQVKYLQKI